MASPDPRAAFASAKSGTMPFVVEQHVVKKGSVPHGVMVITPRAPMIIGRKRIDELRRPSGISPVERWLIEQARLLAASGRIILFRAMNDGGERVWQFDPTLSDPELEEGGCVLSKALLPFHRRLLASGVVLMIHTDWGLRECYAMRSGVQKALLEVDRSTDSGPTREVDCWVLNHMLLHAALKLDHVMASLLPRHLPMVERRWPRVRELVARLPPTAID
jgi:hypothetical protein